MLLFVGHPVAETILCDKYVLQMRLRAQGMLRDYVFVRTLAISWGSRLLLFFQNNIKVFVNAVLGT